MAKRITKETEGEESTSTSACIFCGTDKENELELGKKYHIENIFVHYYCMLFSSGLKQAGATDKDGILGFLPQDIVAEAKRGNRFKCCYCKKRGATVGCCSRYCRKVFHLTCGLQEKSMHQFFGTFCSFCFQHRPKQEVGNLDQTSSTVCPICLTVVETTMSAVSIRSPCCNNSWFHRTCIQKQALNSGYFFKCPMCNDTDTFQEEMLTFGIYIPQQDASWEREENAFQDLLYRHNHCDAKLCICPQGRDFDKEESKWEVKLCAICGSQGIHKHCGRLRSLTACWECPSCKEIIKRGKLMKPDKYVHGTSNAHCLPSSPTKYGKTKKKRRRGPRSKKSRSFDRARDMKNYVDVTLSEGIIKVSLDDWSTLAKNYNQLRKKMQKEKTSDISWLKLKKQYELNENSNSNVTDCEENPQLGFVLGVPCSDISNASGSTPFDCYADAPILSPQRNFPSNISNSADEVDKSCPNLSDSQCYTSSNFTSLCQVSAPHTSPNMPEGTLSSSNENEILKNQTARKSMKSSVSAASFFQAKRV